MAPERGTDEFGLVLVKLEQLVLKRRKLEKVIFLGNHFGRAAAERAIDRIGGISHVKVVVNAVASLIKRFVNVAGIAGAQEQPANGAQMIGRSGPDEMRVADAQLVPKSAKNGGIAIDKFTWGDAEFGRGTR